MGILISKIFKKHKKALRLLMLGLDASGKTSILYQLKLGDIITTIPTIGFNVETVEYKNISFKVWDIGGQDRLRSLWKHYYNNTDGIIFVIDSNDRERLGDNKEISGTVMYELYNLLDKKELENAVLLILANKQDMRYAMTTEHIRDILELNKIKNRSWFVQGTCAKTGRGLYEGLNWLSEAIINKKKRGKKLSKYK